MQTIEARVRAWLVWLAPFAAVLLLLAWETDWGRELKHTPPADAVVKARPVEVALLPEFKLEGGPDARRETIDRTLFNPTRRPAPPAPVVAAQATAMPKGTFMLTGTTVTDGKATALLREVSGGKVRRVQKGETVNGMLVEEVRTDRVKLSMNGDSEELTMRVATGPKTTIQPVPAPAQPGAPVLPQPGQPGQPIAQGAPPPPVVQDVAEVLAQRRRAARAAEAAAQQREAGANPAGAAPVPQPAPAPAGASATTAQPQAQKADPGWNAVYQRYMQPRGGQ
jgi:hypothetical protein